MKKYAWSTMQKVLVCAFGVLAGLCLVSGRGWAADVQSGDLRIEHPTTRATPIPGATAIGYLRITNVGRAADTLLGASSPAATSVEIHQMSMDGGLMRMRALTGGVPIAAGESVDLEPDSKSGDHLMMIGVKSALKEGDVLPVKLRFDKGGNISVEFEVLAIGVAK